MIAYDLDLASGARVCIRFTDADDGDFRVDARGLDELRTGITPHPWTWLRQVHGTDVTVVRAPGDAAGETGDAAVTACSEAVVAVQTADCVPIVFVGQNGVVGAAHAGWKGAAAGVAARTVAELRKLDCGYLQAFIGPAIRPECYEFGAADLAAVADALGDVVRAETTAGTPALDLVAGLTSQLEALDVTVTSLGHCTACEGSWFSHRARADKGRQTSVVWMEATTGG